MPEDALSEIAELKTQLRDLRLELSHLDTVTLGNRRDREEFRKSLQGRLEQAEQKLEEVAVTVTAYQGTINKYLGIFLTALVAGGAGLVVSRLWGG